MHINGMNNIPLQESINNMFEKKVKITSYDQIEPLKNLYDELWNDLGILSSQVLDTPKYSSLAQKYAWKLDKIMSELERDLSYECKLLDIDLSIKQQKKSEVNQE